MIDQAGGFIQTPAVQNVRQWIDDAADELPEGEQIGVYKIIREVGRGGMGAVYLAARADEQYEKYVAIKLVKRGMDTDYVLRHFRNERQILANFEHPNIARLLDGGSTETGLPYFVMEYVEGLPVDEYCDSHHLTIPKRLELFRQICAAVSYAHRHLVIHRDIKPSNIVVTSEGVPKLLDFGIAKILQPDTNAEASATATGVRLMTPEYASPEQAQGLPVTTGSDVYSLGVVLYELLTGHLPYRFQSRSPIDVARVITETEPPMPSNIINMEESEAAGGNTPETISKQREGSPERLRRRLQGDLDNIVLMALRKEPQRRYQSVEHFSEDIRRHLNGLPVMARKDTFLYRGTKFINRNKAAVLIASIAIMAIAVASIIAGVVQWRANQRAKLFQEFGQEVTRIEGIMRYAYLLPLHNVSKEAQIVQERLRIVQEQMNHLGSVSQGPGNYALGRGWMSLHDYDKARQYLELSWNRYNYREPHVANALGLTLTMLYQRELEKASRIRNSVEREERLKVIEEEFRKPALAYVKEGKTAADSPEYVTALILFLGKQYDPALTSAQDALNRIPWLYEARKLQADILTDQANLLSSRGEYDAAAQYYSQAEATYLKAIEIGSSDAETYRALCGMQHDLLMQKVHETGESPEETFSKSIAACEQSLVAQPDSAETYNNLLSIYNVLSYYKIWIAEEDARPVLEKAIQAGEHSLRLRPESADTERMLGRVFISRGEYDSNHGMDPHPWLEKANEHLEAAIRIDPQTPSAYSTLGVSEYYRALYEMVNGKDPGAALDRSIQGYRKAIRLRPTSASYFRDLGATYLLKVEYELDHGIDPRVSVAGANEALTRAVQLNPKEQIAHFNLGQTFIFQALYETSRGINPSKSLEMSKTSLQKAIEINPTDDYSFMVLGWASLIQAEYDADSGANPGPAMDNAVMNMQKALRIAPQRAIGYWYLGMAYSEQSSIQVEKGFNPESALVKARSALEKARNLRPAEIGEVLFWLGKTELHAAQWNLQQGKPHEYFAKKAIQVLEEAIRTNPQLAEAYLAMAQVQVVRAEAKRRRGISIEQEITSGLDSVQRALALNPQLADAFASKGALLQMKNSTADSEAAFNEAFRINPLLRRKYTARTG